jgi:hypothetical protein
LSFREKLVTIFHDLMSPAYQIHVMFLQEPGNYVRAEGEGDTTVILAPASDVLVRIRPQQVAEEAAIGNLFKLVWFRGNAGSCPNSYFV